MLPVHFTVNNLIQLIYQVNSMNKFKKGKTNIESPYIYGAQCDYR